MGIGKLIYWGVCLVSATLLSACGGGGGGSATSTSTSQEAVVLSVSSCQISTPTDQAGAGCATKINWTGGQTSSWVTVVPQATVSFSPVSEFRDIPSGQTVTLPYAGTFTVSVLLNNKPYSTTVSVSCAPELATVANIGERGSDTIQRGFNCFVKNAPTPVTTGEVVVFFDGKKMFAARETGTAVQVYDGRGDTPYDYSFNVLGLGSTCFASTKNLAGGYPLIKCGPHYYLFDIDTFVFRRYVGTIPTGAVFWNPYRGTADLMPHTESIVFRADGVPCSTRGLVTGSTYWVTANTGCSTVPMAFAQPSDYAILPGSLYKRIGGVYTKVYEADVTFYTGGSFFVQTVDWLISSKM